MKKAPMNLLISPIDKNDLAAITALYTTYLNDGEPIIRHLREAMAHPGYIGMKCLDGETIAGVVTAIPGIDFTYPHPELEQRIQSQWGNIKLYSMDMILVQPRYQGQGIARTLAVHLRSQLIEAKIQTLIVEMWNPLRRGNRPAEGVLKYLGKCIELWECPDFYKDLYTKGMTCPDCGKGPCRCGAIIAIVDLNDSEEMLYEKKISDNRFKTDSTILLVFTNTMHCHWYVQLLCLLERIYRFLLFQGKRNGYYGGYLGRWG